MGLTGFSFLVFLMIVFLGRGYLGRQSGLVADTLGISMLWIVAVVPITMSVSFIHLCAHWAEDGLQAAASDQEVPG